MILIGCKCFRAVIIMLKPLYLFNCQLDDDDDDDIACSLPSSFFLFFFALIFFVANHLRQSSCRYTDISKATEYSL